MAQVQVTPHLYLSDFQKRLTQKHAKISDSAQNINKLIGGVIDDYESQEDISKSYHFIKQIECAIDTIFDNTPMGQFHEDELELLTNICRRLNEEPKIQEIRYFYIEERSYNEDIKVVPYIENRNTLSFVDKNFSFGPSQRAGQSEFEKAVLNVDMESNQPQQSYAQSKDTSVKSPKMILEDTKYEEIIELPTKREKSGHIVKSAAKDNEVKEIKSPEIEIRDSKATNLIHNQPKESKIHEVEIKDSKAIEHNLLLEQKKKEKEEMKKELMQLIANMKDQVIDFKLDEAYDCLTKLKNFVQEKKLTGEDLTFHQEKMRQNHRFIEDIENHHADAELILRELQDNQGYILESVKKNFEIKYKLVDGHISLKMEGIIDVPLFNMLSLIYEMNGYKMWMPFCKDSNELKKFTKTSKAGWLKFNLPPPISNREAYIYGIGFNRLNINGSILIISRSIHDDQNFAKKLGLDVPVDSKLTRIDISYLGAAIFPISRDKIKLSVVCKFDPKLKYIPMTLVNWVIRKAAQFLLDILVKKATNFKGSYWENRIKENRDFYSWLEGEIDKYLSKQEAAQAQKK